MELEGVRGIRVGVAAGVAGGVADNQRIRIELPTEFAVQIPPSPQTLGIPLRLIVGLSVSVSTGLSGNESTLTADGEWGLSGPIGASGGSVSAPEFFVVKSLTNSISGIALGPSAVVAAVKFKAGIGIGIAAPYAGPSTSVTVAFGVANGSAFGAPLALCRTATMELNVGAGVQASFAEPLGAALKKRFPGAKLGGEAEITRTVLKRSETVPDVPICQG